MDAGVDSSGTAIAADRLVVSRILQRARSAADLTPPMMSVPVDWQKPRHRLDYGKGILQRAMRGIL